MARGGGLGRDFRWLLRAYAVSALGTGVALDAFSLVAILALHVSAAQVSTIAAASGVAAAVLAVPLGPWIEFRHKRPLMIRADLVRFFALLSVPITYAAGVLSYAQLLAVAVVVAVADIVFTGASGSHLKALLPPEQLMDANGRFETVTWVSTAVGPPSGGALIGALGPVVTVILNAVSFLLSAAGIRAIAAPEPPPPVRAASTSRLREAGEGWRTIAGDRVLWLLFANTVLVGTLIMATAPLLAYRMLHDLGFTPLEYGLGFGVPCLGGIAGARLSRPLVRRYGPRKILLGFGVARVPWLLGLPFVGAGPAGLAMVMAAEFGLITCMGVFNPLFATYRMEHAGDDRLARVITAWKISSRTTIAAATALWGVLAGLTSARTAIAIAGVLMLATPVFLPWRREQAPQAGADARVKSPIA